jgi:hypothetical protein
VLVQLVLTAGVVAALAVLVFSRQGPQALAVLLDLWTAASLLRLATLTSWSAIALAAAVVTLRTLGKSAVKALSARRAAGEAAR